MVQLEAFNCIVKIAIRNFIQNLVSTLQKLFSAFPIGASIFCDSEFGFETCCLTKLMDGFVFNYTPGLKRSISTISTIRIK